MRRPTPATPPTYAARPTRRSLLGGLSLLALAPVVAACGSGSAEGGTAGGAASGATDAGAFPVSIEHRFGTTRLTEAPSRVVVVGLVEQDALLALGVVPVGVTKWFGTAEGQVFPWATSALGDAPVPTVLSNTNGIDVEKVAALAPDLIIGRYAGITKQEYALLSKIAPTVAQSADFVDYGEPWTSSTAAVAAAVGRSRQGKELIGKVEAVISSTKADHPEFAGRTAVCVTPYEGLFVYGPQDPRGRILEQLGFTFPEALDDPAAKEFGWSLSAERTADLADVDVVVWIGDEALVEKGTGGLWGRTTAAQEGRGVFVPQVETSAYYVAQSMVTPLSIPYVLERYAPQLAAAVDGKTSTTVPVVSA